MPHQSSSRITVVETVYHQTVPDQPTALESRFSRFLASDEQVYVRRLTVGEDWQRLDTGWLKVASLLLVSNDEGRGQQVQPTDQERADIAARVIEVAHGEYRSAILPDWLIPPGESLRGCPASLGNIWLRCRQGVARCTVVLFPL